ncbi:MAG: outer membrane beta-barrel protein [Acidobacteriota bacterium]|nr:outer membrane beta-barrel protein [Acidobacteriota bacterium]
MALLSVLFLGSAVSSLTAADKEWKPFKLGLGPSTPLAAGNPWRAPKLQIALFSGFASGWGPQTAEAMAPDLLTADASPWYGTGYDHFNWSSPRPLDLSGDMTLPGLKKDSGVLAGIQVGYSLNPRFQLEGYFGLGFSGYSIDQAIWDDFSVSGSAAVARLQASGRDPSFTDASVQSAGKTILGGLNFNIFFIPKGKIIPYATVGLGILTVTNTPTISWSLTQGTSSTATYTMDVTYDTKAAFLFDTGVGVKIYLASNYGIKVEARGNLAMTSADKIVDTGFSRTSSTWAEFDPYNAVALTEKGTPFFFSTTVGFFYGF